MFVGVGSMALLTCEEFLHNCCILRGLALAVAADEYAGMGLLALGMGPGRHPYDCKVGVGALR